MNDAMVSLTEQMFTPPDPRSRRCSISCSGRFSDPGGCPYEAVVPNEQ